MERAVGEPSEHPLAQGLRARVAQIKEALDLAAGLSLPAAVKQVGAWEQ